jgi:ABC-type sulfate/molybdate transport systems ATPase subunit
VERTLNELADRAGLSMVLVTHEGGQAERMGGRIVRLREGRLA